MDTPDRPETFASNDVRVVRRNPWILGVAALPLIFALGVLVAGITVWLPLLAFVAQLALLGVVALLFVWSRNFWPIVTPTPVRADAEGLTVGDRRVPRAGIRAGFVLPALPPKVLLRRRWALPIELEVPSKEEGRGILRALGLDVTQSVASFRTMSRAVTRRRYTAAIAALFLAVGIVPRLLGSGAASGVGFVIATVLLALVMIVPTRLSVGADGLVLRWFGRSRFLAHGEIAGVTRYDKSWGRSSQVGLAVRLRSGEEVLIPVAQSSWVTQEAQIIEERIREALEAFRAGDAAADAALLRRGGRELAEWIAALRAIGAGANADMRTAPVARERLFRIVESPTAGAPDRAAAAVALGHDLDDDARRRLRVAAEAIAAPRLRFAVEAAASGGEEAEIEAALAEVEQEAARGAPRAPG